MLRWIFLGFLALIVTLVFAPFIALNTGSGRAFVTSEINRLAGHTIQITKFAGHFPADLKLGSFSLSDSQGVYANGEALELRWAPLAILRGHIDITDLTANSINVIRAPTSATHSKNNTGSSVGLANIKLRLAHLQIDHLELGPALVQREADLRVTGSAAWRGGLNGDAELDTKTLDNRSAYRLTIRNSDSAVHLSLTADEPPGGLAGQFLHTGVATPLHFAMSLNGPQDNAKLTLETSFDGAKLTGDGMLDLNPDRPSADVTLHVPALTPIAAMAAQTAAGTATLHIVFQHRSQAVSDIAVDGQVSLSAAPERWAALIGKDGQFALRAKLNGLKLNISQFSASGAGFDASVTGQIDTQNLDLKTNGNLYDVHMLKPKLHGALAETSHIKGSFKNFALIGDMQGTIAAQNIPSGPFDIKLAVQHLPSLPEGSIDGSGAIAASPVTIKALFNASSKAGRDLDIQKLTWRSLHATGHINTRANDDLPNGTAEFIIGKLSDFAVFYPGISGSLAGKFSREQGGPLALTLNAKQANIGKIVSGLDAHVKASGAVNAISFTADSETRTLSGVPFQLATQGIVDVPGMRLKLAALTAHWHGIEAKLNAPTGFILKPTLRIEHLNLDVAGANITADGALSPNLNAKLTITNLAANLVHEFVPSLQISGIFGLNAALHGSLQNPIGPMKLTARGIKLHSGPAAALAPADLNVSAELQGQNATVTAALTNGPNIQLSLQGRIPFTQQGALNANARGQIDLRLLDPFLAVQGRVLKGSVALAGTITGNLNKPYVTGDLQLTRGSFADLGSGLNLTSITATLHGSGADINLVRFTANAGKGTITGHGDIHLDQPNMPVDIRLNANKATPIASDPLTATLDGALHLTGNLTQALDLSGAIEITQANINIPKSLPANIANLPIVMPNAAAPPPAATPLSVQLGLALHARNKIFIRGDGLFAEFGGSLKLNGSSRAPEVLGGFDLIRGSFSLAGKNLQFTKGVISFNGTALVPTIDLEATTTSATNITATLVIGGTADKPTITLTSAPPLPSDQVLAQLLFGQSVTSLSPFQAASLAAALAQLSGLAGTNDPLGSIRSALGLDELSIGSGTGGAAQLQAGRYVAPGVFVGVAQATSGQGTQASVEINLSKHLKLQTATGSSSTETGNASSIGLSYEFNY